MRNEERLLNYKINHNFEFLIPNSEFTLSSLYFFKKICYNTIMQALLEKTKAYRLIQTERTENRLSHAYLLLYDDARNLRYALKTFAKLFFQDENGVLDDRKEKLLDNESFSDCLIFPAEADKKLKVEDAEKILEESLLTPVEGDKKLFLVGDFSEANVQTQNKLLKLLEEPPKGVYFLLGATNAHSVLTTVLSRAKKLEIEPFDVTDITNALQRVYGNKYDKDALSLCAATSDGNFGKAQNMLEGGYYKTLLETAFSLCLCPSYQFPAIVKQAGEIKRQKEFLSTLRIIFRDGLILKTQGKNAKKNLLLSAETENLEKVMNAYTVSAFLYAQEAISTAEKQIFTNANFAQCVEICIAKIQSKN